MMLVLERYIPTFALALERVGPQARLTSLAQAAPQNIVALVGPPGQNAGDTMDGDRGDVRIQGGQWLIEDIDGGTFN
jgi:hypothetical protein